MITESFHTHKDYIIRLRAVTNNGFWYAIIKQINNPISPNGIKNLYLHKKGWNFIEPNKLLSKAINYINNHEDNLIKKYNSLISQRV